MKRVGDTPFDIVTYIHTYLFILLRLSSEQTACMVLFSENELNRKQEQN